MKAIAIVELPDDAFDDEAWGDGKWEIDDEGCIRYQEDNAWMHYKDIDVDGIELRQMPKKRDSCEYPDTVSFENAKYHASGYNQCLKDILGETE